MEEFTSLERLDQDLTLAINAINSPWSDAIWSVFSNKLVWIPLYLAVLFLILKSYGWRKGLIIILSCVLTVLACDQLGNLFKYGFERLRPCWNEYMLAHDSFHLLEGPGGKFGFFSAHAANALGFAVCSSYALKRASFDANKWINPILISWALLVGISRIFVGKHFLGDVTVGFIVGLSVGFCFAILAQKIARRVK